MNVHFDAAAEQIARANAILFAIDATFMEDTDSKLQRLFYAAWDAIKTADSELELLAGDQLVVDAIYAVNDARRRKGEQADK